MQTILVLLFCGLAAFGGLTTHPRPIEITTGEKARRSDSYSIYKEDFSKWRIEGRGVSDIKLEASEETMLWEKCSAKLSFVVDKKNAPFKEITLYPPNMPLIHDEFDMCEFWVNGPTLYHAYPELEFTSSDGQRSFIPVVGGGHHWNHQSYWGTALGTHAPSGKAPWRLTAIHFSLKPVVSAAADNQRQTLYFDEFSFFKRDLTKNDFSLRAKYPKPTTPDTILPPAKDAALKNSIAATQNGWDFIVESEGKRQLYRYTPHNGTFGDIEIIAANGKAFFPAIGGGPEALVGNIRIAPDDASATSVLLGAKVEGNSLKTRWRREKGSAGFTYSLNLTLKGKSLVIDVKGDEPVIEYIRPGHTENTPNLRLVPVSYWDSRWGTNVVMVANGVFTTLVMDAYSSEGSYHIEGGYNYLGIHGQPLKTDDNHAQLLGGTIYCPLSDGTRNPCKERWFLTVSDDFDEVLPTIPNPKSPYLEKTASRIYCSRSNFLTSPDIAKAEAQFWKRLKAFGMDDMFIRFHMEVMGSPIESNRLARELNANSLLGDDALTELIDSLHGLGYAIGLYSNNRVIHALAPEYVADKVALNLNFLPDQQWSHSNFLNRPCDQILHLEDYVPKIKAKFHVDGVYSDEQTNRPPWGMTDFEAGVPGAGKFSEVLFGYMAVMQREKELYNHPIWSEGTSQHFFAGYTDMNYAQSNRPNNPIIVNWQLREIHARQNDVGYELAAVNPKWSVDYWLASEIVFGNVGSLMPGVGKVSMMQGHPDVFPEHANLAKCYFMIRALQELYSGQLPKTIRYAREDGALVDTSTAVRQRVIENNFVYVQYMNGLEVWVNRNEKKSWTIQFKGKPLVLPPCGYAACLDGKILEYSAGEKRADYVESDLYCYADGRGVRTDFPKIAAAGAYMWRRQDGGIRLIQQAGNKEETIRLKGMKAKEILPLDMHGRPLDEKVAFKKSGKDLEITVSPTVFQYQIR